MSTKFGDSGPEVVEKISGNIRYAQANACMHACTHTYTHIHTIHTQWMSQKHTEADPLPKYLTHSKIPMSHLNCYK